MKKLLYFILCTLVLTSCSTQKRISKDATIKHTTTLEGEKVQVEIRKMQGIEMAEALDETGTNTKKVPYKWFSGFGKADNKQVAVEMAQREAYATISRVIMNIVEEQAERGSIANNGKVQQALKSYWSQVSLSIEKACEPFGETIIEYNAKKGMYDVIAKIGVKGERYMQLLNDSGNFRPANLSGEELENFIETNKAILEAAKGN